MQGRSDSHHPPFDTVPLREWLRHNVPMSVSTLEVRRFENGQSNPTYLLDLGGRKLVLRRKPAGLLLPSAHAIEREFRIMRALSTTGIPVPECIALCEDATVIGSAFYVMQFVEGRIFDDPSLPSLSREERAAVYAEMNRVIASLHALDPNTLGLGDYGRFGAYIQRQVQRWTAQYRASQTEEIAAMERLITWLPLHIPPHDETRIVHGDFRLDNVIFAPHEPRIVAVLDWELSTLGHPLADFAYHCLPWYRRSDNQQGLEKLDLQSLGLPTVGDYLTAYCSRLGREVLSPHHWEFYVIFNMFRAVGILQGVAKRALQGNASSPRAAEVGGGARPLAESAWRRVEALGTVT